MRLICPNCGAQYEIDEGLIPAAGRDVQCSNCGHTWFETPGASVEAETLAEEIPAEQEVTPPPAASEAEPPDAARAALDSPSEDSAPGTETIDAEPISETPGPKPREASNLDPEVAAILREEAEHERQRRTKAAEQIESQPDLGLDAPAKHKDESSGRDRLPDIEEINSSLRSDPNDDDTTTVERSGSGFWRGFWLMVLVAIALVLIYTAGPKIAARVPQAAPAIDGYRTTVDGLRLKLNDTVQSLGDRMGQESDAQ
ncbi:MAG: thioredoxin [Rhodobacterales bacterium]|nr:MAG: thioredoxin [Rhodobacterales bacterium]